MFYGVSGQFVQGLLLLQQGDLKETKLDWLETVISGLPCTPHTPTEHSQILLSASLISKRSVSISISALLWVYSLSTAGTSTWLEVHYLSIAVNCLTAADLVRSVNSLVPQLP